MWFPTAYGVRLASEWPELRGHRPSRTVSDPTAVRLKARHALTVTETALVFLKDARHRGELCQPLDWMTEVHHPIGSGEAVIPDALLYYRHGPVGGSDGPMLRAFVEVDRATMGPERLAAKLTAYERLYRYAPAVLGRRPALQEPAVEDWLRRYPHFPRVLFVLDGTGPAGVENRISALHAGSQTADVIPLYLRRPPPWLDPGRQRVRADRSGSGVGCAACSSPVTDRAVRQAGKIGTPLGW
ncbi:replication-relaxation family protein [Streptomyces sp. NPDC059255]|uniref:replication-relaxation family protein n=1 Tax=Streptomyces sp. NPDC059255 TaxID=3346793 RepID=UPI0036AEA087